MLKGKIKLGDIFEVGRLQRLQDTFADEATASVVIVDPGGNRITQPSIWTRFCNVFSEMELAEWACTENTSEMLEEARRNKRTAMGVCPHTGLATAAIPIFLDELFLGCWIFGQLKWDYGEQMEPAAMERAARLLDTSVENVWCMLDELPLKSTESFEKTCAFLEALTETLIRLGHYNIENHRQAQALERAAYFDAYTGLPNTRRLMQDLQELDASGDDLDGQLICFHLSSMKSLNSVYGREAGNAFICKVAAWVQAQSFGGSLYRNDGFSFSYLLCTTELKQAKAVAKTIHKRFADSWMLDIDGEEVPYFCSAAVSIICLKEEMKKLDIMNLIDRTLIFSRENQNIFVYNAEMDRRAEEELQMEMELKRCVKRGMKGFDVHFQPIVDSGTGLWKGLEALCRWTNSKGMSTPPDRFIREAEKLGLISALGEWVLDTATRHCEEIGLTHIDGFFLSVNISAVQVMAEDFAERVLTILRRNNFPGEKLNLEVTESTEISFTNFTFSLIEKLRSYGIHMAIDDFGTGYSSFNNLKNLPVSFLKTERDFVKEIETDTHLQYFFYVMSEIAHANDMRLIAEGVETREQLEVIKANGADYVQGYFFSKPLEVAELSEKLRYFLVPDPMLYTGAQRHIDIDRWLSGKKAYVLTPSLLIIQNRCMKLLLSDCCLDEALEGVLSILGEHFAVDHAHIFLKKNGNQYINTHTWNSARMNEPLDKMQIAIPGTAAANVRHILKRDGMMSASDVSALPPDVYDVFASRDIQSVLMLPMWNGESLMGFAGFGESVYREWTPEEIILLWNLCMLLLHALKRETLQNRLDGKGCMHCLQPNKCNPVNNQVSVIGGGIQ